MDFQRAPWKKVFITIFELAVAINLILLNIWVWNMMTIKPSGTNTQQEGNLPTPTINSPLPNPSVTNITAPTSLPTPIIQTIQAPSSPSVTDYYIEFGGGQSTATTWTNVPGLQAYINSTSYPNPKTIVFEASVNIPTGNQTASVQLFDVTQQHPVWFSQVSMAGGTPQFLVSQPITLDPGNNLYQVQMTTQLGFTANLTQSRIHVTLQ